MIRLSQLLRLSLVAAPLLFSLTACGPRGETKSLDEVFRIAKARYASVQSKDLAPEVQGQVGGLVSGIESLVTASAEVAPTAVQVAEALHTLTPKAGFTSRPALGELEQQYRAIAARGAQQSSPAQLKLIASRTYSILATEIETTKFNVG